MAYIDNYPNGYKSGYSSADDPERKDYSPYGLERQTRGILEETEKREYEAQRNQEYLDKQRINFERNEAQRLREEHIRENRERQAKEEFSQRREAINLIVKQKRDEYNKKSWFGKAVAKLQGNSFDKTKAQIT